MKGIRKIETGDGSNSLFHEELNETYHSTHGALRESTHVFIEHGLQAHPSATPEILEFGFGTGLNVLLTAAEAWNRKHKIRLTTLEAYPLEMGITDTLNYPELIDHPAAKEWFAKIHASPWGDETRVHEFFQLKKVQTTFESFTTDDQYDIIYFDAFAPSRQPHLWRRDLLSNVVGMMKKNGIFVTYSAMGQLKRDLKLLGLQVETLNGPPGKKEMVRAVKQ